jgi:hypothetical protein
MKKIVRCRLGWSAAASVILASLLIGGLTSTASGASCLPTGALDRDGTPLTARIVNPTSPVTGKVDAVGCEVGVYFDHGNGKVVNAEVFGARYYGVLVDGNGHKVSADVLHSKFHDIGDATLTSARHGQGVAYRGFDGTATGTAAGNRIWNYQEAGLNATGPGSTASFIANDIRGRGAQDVISQNGIQVIFGAHGVVRANVIRDLRFLGPNTGNGILVVGGPGYGQPYTRDTQIDHNVVSAADVGINVFEIEEDDSPSPLPTRVVIAYNLVSNDSWTNTRGWDGSIGFQAGIAVYANGDRIVRNLVTGAGYHADTCGDAAICSPIFTDGSIDPIISGNILR